MALEICAFQQGFVEKNHLRKVWMLTGKHNVVVGHSIWPLCKVEDSFWSNVMHNVKSRGNFILEAQMVRSVNLAIQIFKDFKNMQLPGCLSSWFWQVRKWPDGMEPQTKKKFIGTWNFRAKSASRAWSQWRLLICLPDKSGKFSVRNCCNTRLQAVRQPVTQVTSLPLKLILDSYIPARVNFFLWEVDRQAVQTKQRLHRFFPDKDTSCILCLKGRGIPDPPPFMWVHTPYMEWNISGFGFNVPNHYTLKSRFVFWLNQKGQNDIADWFWSRAPAAIMWSVWLQRNGNIFRNRKVDWQDTLYAVLLRLRFWGQKGAASHISVE